MKKILKMFLVVIIGTIGACASIWLLSTTSTGVQQASARGETFGIIIAVAFLALIGLAIFKYLKKQ